MSLFMFFFVLTGTYAQDFNYEVISKKMPFYTIDANYQSVNEILPVKLGFNYQTKDGNFNVVFISPQGWISFEPIEDVRISDFTQVNNLVSPYLLKKNGRVAYQIIDKDNNKMLVVQWQIQKELFSQLVIKESGEIEFHYVKQTDVDISNFQAGIITKNEVYGSFDVSLSKKSSEIDFNIEDNYIFSPNIFVNSCKNGQKAILASDYSFSASSGSFSGLSNGNFNALEDDDVVPNAKNIGFTFNYCGVDYTQVEVSSNGWFV